jgi:hypothetical protein
MLIVHRSVFLNFVRPGPACIAALGTGLLAQVIAGSTAVAQSESRVVADPPPLAIQQGKAPRATMMAAPSAANIRTEKQLDLNVVYTDSQIYNPGTGRSDKVRLRSYAGSSVTPNAPYVAPTIEVDPGDTVRITLNNKLPADPSCTTMHEDPNNPHCFNGTNLHSHGLWISPTGNGDNVLLSINPGVSFQYEYNIPPDHPAGTFWYHPHRHGSTALQVSSGMACVDRARRPAADGTAGSAAGEARRACRCCAAIAAARRASVPALAVAVPCCRNARHRRRRRGQRGEIFALAPGQEGVPICRIEPDFLRRRSAGACGGSVARQRITCWRQIGGGRVRQRCGHRVPSPPRRPGRTLCRVPLVAPPGFASDSAVFPRLRQRRKGVVSRFWPLYAR